MSYYSDPTANAAIGAAEKELNIMRKKAQKIKRLLKYALIFALFLFFYTLKLFFVQIVIFFG